METFSVERRGGRLRAPGAVIIAALVIIVLLFGRGIVDFVTEWLWFQSLGLTSVFITSTITRVGLLVGGALLFSVAFGTNVVITRRLATEPDPKSGHSSASQTWDDLLAQISSQVPQRDDYARLIYAVVGAVAVLLAILMGLLAASNWVTLLLLLNQSPFGIADPVFGQDVAFYLFEMPILRAVELWLFLAWSITSLAVFVLYATVFIQRWGASIDPSALPRHVKGHLLGLAAVGFLLLAGQHVLDMFDLIRSTRGAAYGASYTDVHVQLPAQLVMAAVALLASGLCVASSFRGSFRLAIVGAGAWLAALLTVGWGIPTVVQAVVVAPNELDRERPYIGATLRFTRHAFGLDRIDDFSVAFQEAVTPAALADNQDTVNNIRLWDPRPLLDTYKQIQTIRQYYQFDDVDVDRYIVDGTYRQVMVAARELVSNQLPREAQSWVSQQLQYTHGYGVAMSGVNLISQEGLPDLIVRDLPPVGQITVTRPEIYFGQKTDHYVVTRTATPEFDYPGGDKGVFVARYGAEAGIDVGSLPMRALFALKFQDPNFVLNTSFQKDSQLLYRRNVVQRAQSIAPFLRLDADPYMVVADGSLYWIQDAYTVSDRYPYSEPSQPIGNETERRQRPFNYIRNSVKMVTSAYDGTIRFYIADPADPLIQSFARIFPALFVPQEEAPASIRAHFRYPEGLFLPQAEKLRLFHIEDERVFYLREDQWTIANELFADKKQPVDPYYVIMKLPGQDRPEFILMLPFTPGNRDNMIGWLAARSDGPDYGKLLLYEYPKDTVIYGPFQIETRIDQDPAISAQFSLWNQAGSQVIRGNLLTIPIGQSNLYVEPIYLQATQSPLPELKRVVVSTGNRIVMEPTLGEALARLFGTGVATTPAPPAPATVAPERPSGPLANPSAIRELVNQAQDQFQRAEDALRVPDFNRYGEELSGLKDTLNRLVEASNPELP